MVAWVTDLKDGSPLPDAQVRAFQGGAKVVTGKDGVVRFDIPDGSSYLVASQGADQALLPRSIDSWYEEEWTANPPQSTLRWYVFDDRQMYKPGEEVHVKGWLRLIGGRQNCDVALAGGRLRAVNYQVTDPQGNALGNGRVNVNSLGGFDFAFTIAEATNLGYAQLYLTAEGDLGVLDGVQRR